MRFIPEELIDDILIRHFLEYFRGQSDYSSERSIQKVRFKSQFNLHNILSSHSFIIKFEQLLSDQKRINILKLNRKQHLAVSMHLLQHFRIAVLQVQEKFFNSLENLFFRLRRVDPFSQSVKHFLFVDSAVVFSPHVCVDACYALI